MLHIAMAVGLVVGLAFGLLASITDSALLLTVVEGSRPLGTLFINAIRMVVIPLVVTTIFVGVVRLGSPKALGRMGGSAVGFFWITTIPAILLGVGLAAMALPFAPPVTLGLVAPETAPELPGLIDFLVGLVPSNPFEAATNGDLLGLIVFTALFAAAASALPDDRRRRLLAIVEDVSDALVTLVNWILWTAPVGIFALSAPVTATSGWDMLASLVVFIGAVVVGLVVFVALVYLPLVRFVGGLPVRLFLRAILPSQIVAFTTTSSVATLPVMLDASDDLRVSHPVASLVMSLGAAINRAGSALFQGAAVVYLAHLSGVSIPTSAFAGAVIAVFLAAMSVAPVPSASIMTLAPALDVVGVPLTGLGLLLGIDRIPDMFRTTVNVTGHMAAAVVVEGVTGEGGVGDESPAAADPESS